MNAESKGSPAKHANYAKAGAEDLKAEPVTVSNRVPDSDLKALPLMKTVEDALALCDQHGDNFYLAAFMLQEWLGQLLVNAAVEYSEKKDARERVLQNGRAWRVFGELLHPTTAGEFREIVGSLLRFAEHNDPLAGLLRCALVPFAIEYECDSASFSALGSALARLCGWVDAVAHWQTHEHWHLAPVCFDPDPDRREVALLGTTQRHFARLDGPGKARWQWQFWDAAERFSGSVKWSVLGQAMSCESDRVWPYREVDALVIGLWPMVTRHNWTYCDLLNVIRPALSRPDVYPCDREQSLATHCVNALGLRKAGNGKTARDGRPAGWEVAGKIIRATGRILNVARETHEWRET